MKNYFPPQNQSFKYLQTNRSDDLGSIWSSFNLDFQSNLGTIRLAQKLVANTSSTDDADLGVPCAFEYWGAKWWSICDTTIFNTADADITGAFTEDTNGFLIGDSTTQFDITNPSGTTFRYTFDGTGTDPLITALTFPVGAIVVVNAQNFNAGNKGTFTVTDSGANYFEVTNAAGVEENDKTIGTGNIRVAHGSQSKQYNFQQSDLCVFDGRLWATTSGLSAKLYSLTNNLSVNSWVLRDDLGPNSLHKMVYFKKFNRLYFGNTATIISSINTSNTVSDPVSDYAIDLTNSINEITTMVASSDYIWIGTTKIQNATNGGNLDGSILAWDGLSQQVTNEYVIQAAGVLSMVVLNDIPYAIDSEGRILKYTGYSFEELGRLPIDRILLSGASTSYAGYTTGKFVHFNGMQATKNNTLLVLVKNLNEDSQADVTENLQSGVWEFDLNTNNFTHKYSCTLKTLASSTVTDFGQNKLSIVGALKMNTLAKSSASGRGTLLVGAKYFTDATTEKSSIFIDSPVKQVTNTEGQKRGYFVTTWFESPEIESTFTKIWAVYKRFENSTDKIIFKYRLTEEDPIETTITWTSTTTFTTTTNISTYVGYEAEIIQGTGSGACANILTVTEASGTYTATIDTAITGVTGTAKARFQKWKKIYPEASGTVKSFKEMPFDATNTKIQIKGILEWTGDGEFSKFILMSDEDIISNL